MAGRIEKVVWRVVGLGTAVAAGMVAKKLATAVWKRGTGHAPPTNPEAPGVNWGQALGWAVASGAFVGVVRMLVSRELASEWRKTTGHLPPGTRDVS